MYPRAISGKVTELQHNLFSWQDAIVKSLAILSRGYLKKSKTGNNYGTG